MKISNTRTSRISKELDVVLEKMSQSLTESSGLIVSKADASRLASRILAKNFKIRLPK